jgi:cell division protein FtsB
MSLWTLIYRTCWVLLIVMILVGAAMVMIPRWQEMRAYQQRQIELQREIETEEEMIKLLRMKQERFQTDPEFVERLARDLGLVRSNEVLIRVTTETSGTAAASIPVPGRTRSRTPARPGSP